MTVESTDTFDTFTTLHLHSNCIKKYKIFLILIKTIFFFSLLPYSELVMAEAVCQEKLQKQPK